MKIQNNMPINGHTTTQKAKRKGESGLFKSMFESEITEASNSDTPQQSSPSRDSSETAWHSLEEGVSLLDQAMLSLESGEMPSEQLIQNIDQLRTQLKSQLSSGKHSSELQQADTLLAVEAERIRSLQS